MDLGGGIFLSLVLTLTCLVFITVWKSTHQRSKLPPGPIPLPFLGNVLQLDSKNLVKSILKLGEKYGTVFTIHIGSRPLLVLCGYDTVKEALVDQADDFSGRGHFPVFHLITKGYEGAFDPTFVFGKTVANVICSVVFGTRFDYEDKKYLSLLQLFNENFRFLNSTWAQLLNRFPGIIQPLPGPHRKVQKNVKVAKRFVKEYIKEHQATLDPGNPRDFIDCFLIKMQQETQNPDTEFSRKNLVMTTLNLFVAGTETVSTTLRYGLMILLKNPEVEEKVHKEIDHVIGESRPPCMEDRSKMPYTDAVIHEIQRFIDIIPLNLPHSVTRDTTFRGYTIPKGTDVIPVLSSVLHDLKKFGNPECFDPQRFLDDNGCFKKNDAFVPFSAGKRMCLGEGLARMELFLFFTTILQNFTLKANGNPDNIDLTPEMSGFSHLPRWYQLQLIPRLR
ncbi:cytochrome P450 2G1-like isoform X2 [Lissotriton helveticus]